MKRKNGKVTVGDLPPLLAKRKTSNGMLSEEEIRAILKDLGSDMDNEIDFEGFLRVSL